MTDREDIRALIAAVDEILAKKNALFTEGDRDSTVAILEKIRRYLASASDRAAVLERTDPQQILAFLEQPSFNARLSSLEQFERLQQQSNRLLLSLDANLQAVFATLEKDLQGYCDSLSQGLERMHSLGQQGEAKFLAYVRRLTQQVETLPTQKTDPPVNLPSPPEEIYTISALTNLIEPEPERGWFLALDFGNSGLAAVLFDRDKEQIYPLAWISQEGEFCERLPTDVYCQPNGETQQLAFTMGTAAKAAAKDKTGILLTDWKETLQSDSPDTDLAQQALEALFSVVIPADTKSVNGLIAEALGLTEESFQQGMDRLEGAIVSCPTGWGEPYQKRLQRAILKAQLVEDAAQICFIEEAIAVLLADLSLNATANSTVLVIHAGAIATELALATIPEDYRALSSDDISLQSFACGGRAIDEDILVQLLYPQWVDRLSESLPKFDGALPQPGNPEPAGRAKLRSQLQNHPIGQSCLEAARLTKLILQEQEEFRARLGACTWSVKRQDLIVKAIGPYLDRLAREIDALLGKSGKSANAIDRVICSGGTMRSLWHALYPWLQKKLPDAFAIENIGETSATPTAVGLACAPLFPLILERP